MSVRREGYTSTDGRQHTLWGDIDDVVDALIVAHHGADRAARRERGWMFRGEADATWPAMTPSLFRAPADRSVIAARSAYTDAFIDALRQRADLWPILELSQEDFEAIAQHYGFPTSLLDFSLNLEVAAHFATLGARPDAIGVIYAFNEKEFRALQNPFSVFGLPLEKARDLLRDLALPDLAMRETLAPRIVEQEGVFINVPEKSIASVRNECIDRFYFRQRAGKVYVGKFPHKRHWLMERSSFATDRAYEAYIAQAGADYPDLFSLTSEFGSDDLFPPNDPLSKFAMEWKSSHPNPLAPPASERAATSPIPSAPGPFEAQIDAYYYGDFCKSPYDPQFLAEGRAQVDALRAASALADPQTLQWLLWELLRHHLPDLEAVLRVSDASTWDSQSQGFRITLIDRWLARSYDRTLKWEDIRRGFQRISFGHPDNRGRAKAAIAEIEAFEPPRELTSPEPENPHCPGQARTILQEVEQRLRGREEGVIGSFLYDLHNISLLSAGRNLEIDVGVVPEAPCMQRHPLARQDHVRGPAVLVRVSDRFGGSTTHTSVCARHYQSLSECKLDLMRMESWTMLGVA